MQWGDKDTPVCTQAALGTLTSNKCNTYSMCSKPNSSVAISTGPPLTSTHTCTAPLSLVVASW